ncbi:MAG: hypothetical protein ABL977_09015, partial [Candidatus Eisenbacteria bacterium]
MLLAVLPLALFRVPVFARWVLRIGLESALADPDLHVKVVRVAGNGFRRLELDGLVIERRGEAVLSVHELRAQYSLSALLAGRLEVERCVVRDVLAGGRADSTAAPAPSAWDWLAGRAWQGLPLHVRAFELANLSVQGGSDSTGVRLDSLCISGRELRLQRGRATVHVDTLTLRSRSPLTAGRWCTVEFAGALERGQLDVRRLLVRGGRTALEAAGVLALGREHTLPVSSARFTLHAHPLALEDVGALLGQPGARGALEADAELTGMRLDGLSGRLRVRTPGVVWPGVELGESHVEAELDSGQVVARADGRWRTMPFTLQATGRPFAAEPAASFDARLAALERSIPGAPWWRAGAPRALQLQGTLAAGRLAYSTRMSGIEDALASRGELDVRREARWVVRGATFERVSLTGRPLPGGDARADSVVLLRAGATALELHGLALRAAELARWSGTALPASSLNARVDGRMEWGAAARGQLRVRLAASSFAGVPAGPGELRVDYSRSLLRVAGELAALSGHCSVVARIPQGAGAGEATLMPLRFTNVDLAPWLATGSHTRLNGELSGTWVPGDSVHAAGRVQLRLAESQWNGRTLSEAWALANLRAGQLAVASRVVLGREALTSRLAADLTQSPPSWQGTGEVPLALVATFAPHPPVAHGAARFEVVGRGGTLATLAGRARIEASGDVAGVALDTLHGAFHVA